MSNIQWLIPTGKIAIAQKQLNSHPLLHRKINSIATVTTFMEHHVYAVWDFMSLLKSLQHIVCPSSNLWIPSDVQRQASRLINEIVLGEECDESPTGEYMSHFDLYCMAMREVGADTTAVDNFIKLLQTTNTNSLNQILLKIPSASRTFVHSTFDAIATGKPHVIAAYFAFGRETVIPAMFTELRQSISALNAPALDFYLARHIELDGDSHGPASLKLIDYLCDNDPTKITEAHNAAIEAINHRFQFWTDISRTLDRIEEAKK